jgi:hypothetical protein
MSNVDRRHFLAAAFALAARPGAAQSPDPLALLASMVQAYAKVSDFTMELHKEELVKTAGGEALSWRLVKEVGQVRFRKRPAGNGADGAPYVRDIRFDKGCALLCPALYREGLNDDRIAIRGVINVDPHGARAMDGQHHPITNVDLGATIGLIHEHATRAQRAGVLTASIDGRGRFDDREVHEFSARLDGGTRGVRVQAGETLRAFAQRTGTQVHLLVHHNDRLATAVDAVAAGTELVVPDYYARRVRLWIDVERLLPLQIEVYDASDRLYERYSYRKLAINVGLTDDHFR